MMPERSAVLYVGCWPREFRSRRFAGIVRYAQVRDWNVVPLMPQEVPDDAALLSAIARWRSTSTAKSASTAAASSKSPPASRNAATTSTSTA
ncbi:MAG: hypothetical protein IJP66_04795 [Kiritimatiellae bacterium]|nr:hypothetical protein [Kiritimatiellia bacterium]